MDDDEDDQQSLLFKSIEIYLQKSENYMSPETKAF